MINNSIQFTCECGNQQCWITEGEATNPCPSCGRQYYGFYSLNKPGIQIVKMKPRLNPFGFKVVPWNKKLNKPTKIIICVLILLVICTIGAVIQTCYVPKEYLTISRVVVSLVAFIVARIVYGKLGGNR